MEAPLEEAKQQQADTTKKAELIFTYSSATIELKKGVLDDALLKSATLQSQSTNVALTLKTHDEVLNTQSTKRPIEDKDNLNKQPITTYPSLENFPIGKNRVIADLSVDVSSDISYFVNDLAEILLKSRKDLLLKVLKNVTKEKIIELFNKTQSTERTGGMLVDNYTRRTPGGVFFYHLRGDPFIIRQQKRNIFDEDTQKCKKILQEERIKRM